MDNQKPKAHTTATLRDTLFDTISGVISGDITEGKAKAVAALAERIVKTAHLEIEYTEHCERMDASAQDVKPGPMYLSQQDRAAALESGDADD